MRQPFTNAETAEVIEREILRKEKQTREIPHDLVNGIWKLADFSDEGERILQTNSVEHGSKNKNTIIVKEIIH